jgi:hypothetical protein
MKAGQLSLADRARPVAALASVVVLGYLLLRLVDVEVALPAVPGLSEGDSAPVVVVPARGDPAGPDGALARVSGSRERKLLTSAAASATRAKGQPKAGAPERESDGSAPAGTPAAQPASAAPDRPSTSSPPPPPPGAALPSLPNVGVPPALPPPVELPQLPPLPEPPEVPVPPVPPVPPLPQLPP